MSNTHEWFKIKESIVEAAPNFVYKINKGHNFKQGDVLTTYEGELETPPIEYQYILKDVMQGELLFLNHPITFSTERSIRLLRSEQIDEVKEFQDNQIRDFFNEKFKNTSFTGSINKRLVPNYTYYITPVNLSMVSHIVPHEMVVVQTNKEGIETYLEKAIGRGETEEELANKIWVETTVKNTKVFISLKLLPENEENSSKTINNSPEKDPN